ncbi:triose-phosphate isomerase [Rhizobium sp. R72]|uniref:triose-phosphate isomerase family protein n=1 Tax=unclassified Rhizobium TaxID=2613769 RepID=UPI000B52B1F8|nr:MULTISPECIES: triose-phosphate isomerase [unclassified Rhizobium]OWW04156.1 triose-phosphate isomerase [Rhizobium sp. R72]OWW04359.1 triose-phosphate isomerase [Rhizobium sp. R711]
MRKLIAGNWKMNGLASSLAETEALKGLTGTATCDIVVCPPFTLIEKAVAASKDSVIFVGAQDCRAQSTGAYTGDVPAEMLAEIDARFVIIGHSERRSAYREADTSVAAKAAAAHKAGLTSIICVGETREEHDDREAIGTGPLPTVEQIEEVDAAVRQVLKEPRGDDGRRVRILDGGSLKASNAAAIFDVPNVDGALVGGASLKASEFAGIISAAV